MENWHFCLFQQTVVRYSFGNLRVVEGGIQESSDVSPLKEEIQGVCKMVLPNYGW